tara:strand:+ start:12262 stop:13746 length:1485 start_codon:yes stop_codon:yes gene_type:complete
MKRFVKKYTAELHGRAPFDSDSFIVELLWGDGVEVLEQDGSYSKVRARGKTGWVRKSALGTKSLLEVYFIDVGQGDGILIRFPDGRHMMIDGGWPRKSQPTGKNAADFVDWKFCKDYRADRIALDDMVVSHNDQDHYGGLWDLLNPKESDELDLEDVRVENFYHAGLSWWKDGGRNLGPYKNTPDGAMFTRLVDDRDSVREATNGSGTAQLQGEWAKFMKVALKARTSDGSPTPFMRLSNGTAYFPGYEPDGDAPTIKLLAPVEFEVDGKPAVRKYKGSNSKSTNGNSVLMRLDYKNARILLTGDLNTYSQQALLSDYAGQHDEFECDVAKACHHGSGDVSHEFLSKLKPSVTVISSGDNEGHDHPKPDIVAASALTGNVSVVDDVVVTPLVYSTELARSTSLGTVTKVETSVVGQPEQTISGPRLKDVKITYKVKMAGDRNPRTRSRSISSKPVVAGLIYGLVNVRTDGKTVLCATLDEKKNVWNYKTFEARF